MPGSEGSFNHLRRYIAIKFTTLTHFKPMPISMPSENVRKPEVFYCFQGTLA